MNVTHKRTALKTEAAIENYFQGALIDDEGREIPITREMIQAACHELESSCPHPSESNAATQRRQRLS